MCRAPNPIRHYERERNVTCGLERDDERTENCVRASCKSRARRFATSPGKVGSVLYIRYLMKPLDAMDAGYPNTYFGGSIRCMFDEVRFGHSYIDVAPAQ